MACDIEENPLSSVYILNRLYKGIFNLSVNLFSIYKKQCAD